MTANGAKVMLVTGATDGLGRALATELARQGATVLLHGRDETAGSADPALGGGPSST